MKHRLLTAFAIRRSSRTSVWWGVPYNPYGMASYAHPYPLRFFDFRSEVMLGEEFWNFVGDERGTFRELLAIYERVGHGFEEEIRRVLVRP